MSDFNEIVTAMVKAVHSLPLTLEDISMPLSDGTHRIVTAAARRIVQAANDAAVDASRVIYDGLPSYVPGSTVTTEQLRYDYADMRAATLGLAGVSADEFDRWLTEHDQQVLASRPAAPAGVTVTREAVVLAYISNRQTWVPGAVLEGGWWRDSTDIERVTATLTDLGIIVTETPTEKVN